MQAVFGSLKGVKATAGYAGGAAGTAHYDIVSGGGTGHAESVELVYDPSQISLQQILDVYFLVAHDPTELNRQGPDEGTQYRSQIFYTTAEQRSAAEAAIAELTRTHAFAGPIVTKVTRLNGFYAGRGVSPRLRRPQSGQPVYRVNDIPKSARAGGKIPVAGPAGFSGGHPPLEPRRPPWSRSSPPPETGLRGMRRPAPRPPRACSGPFAKVIVPNSDRNGGVLVSCNTGTGDAKQCLNRLSRLAPHWCRWPWS